MAIAFIVYFIVLGVVCRFAYRKHLDKNDFMVGGRQLSYWVTALSAHASDMSSWLFLGLPAAIYTSGLKEASAAVGLVTGMAIVWHTLAPKIRQLSEENSVVTLPQFYQSLIAPSGRAVQKAAAGASIFFFIFYIASGLKGLGTLCAWGLGWPIWVGVVLCAAIICAYTFIGGFLMIAFADAFQAIFLLIVIVSVPAAAWFTSPQVAWNWDLGDLSLWTSVEVAFTWGLGYFGMPHILSKFMAIDDPNHIPKAKKLGLAWQTLALSSAVAIGLVASSFTLESTNPDEMFLQLISQLFPPFVIGLVVCAVMAATISTIDSQVIVAATSLAGDLVGRDVRVSGVRRAIIVVTALGAVIAVSSNRSLHEIVRYAWVGQGATFGPLTLFSLYTRVGQISATLAMMTGAIMAAVWPIFGGEILESAMIPAFAAATGVLLIGSWLENGSEKTQQGV